MANGTLTEWQRFACAFQGVGIVYESMDDCAWAQTTEWESAMQTGYFNATWQDIKNSPGWFGKLVLLALVSLIPVFGWIVLYGYLYGWARDIAWGVHAPMPARILGNEDGKLYSRGFFALVISMVCAFVPSIIAGIGSAVLGVGLFGFGSSLYGGSGWMHLGLASALMGMLFSFASLALAVLVTFFEQVGTMRMSIYGRLSAGFQLGRIWAMIRHDFGGLLRILGMAVLLGMAMAVVVSVFMLGAIFVGMAVGFAAAGAGVGHVDAAMAGLAIVIVIVVIAVSVLAVIALGAMSVFSYAMIIRALGYWTRQFNVPAWRGQDDPMPFELARGAYPGGAQPPF